MKEGGQLEQEGLENSTNSFAGITQPIIKGVPKSNEIKHHM